MAKDTDTNGNHEPAHRHVARADTWFVMAQRIRAEIDATPSASRLAVYERFSSELELAADTLRWSVGAARFIDFVAASDPVLAKGLSQSGMAGVRILARWSKRDQAAAFDAARRYVGDDITIAALNTLERTGRVLRPERLAPKIDDRFTEGERERMIAAVTDFVRRSFGEGAVLKWGTTSWASEARLRRRPQDLELFLKIQRITLTQLVFTASEGPPVCVSLHLLKPRSHSGELLVRLVGLVALIAGGYHAVLIVDDARDLAAAQAFCEQLPSASRAMFRIGQIDAMTGVID